jgi:hypothetical protein
MRTTHIARSLVAVVLSLAAASASAQDARTFDDLGRGLNVGDRVRVVGRDGVQHDGTVQTLPPGALVIVGPDGVHSFAEETTSTVARRGDSVWTGALIGFVPGYFLGVQFTDSVSEQLQPASGGVKNGFIGGAIGAAIGMAIDAARDGEQDIYVARIPPRVVLTPAVSRHAIGGAVTMRW